jgi:hypothetical protein
VGFDAALAGGSSFATLAVDGETRLAAARDRLQHAVSGVQAALDALVAETDDQADDVIKYDPGAVSGYDSWDDSLGTGDVQEVRGVLNDAAATLVGPSAIAPGVGLGSVLEFLRTGVDIDASRFFTAPVQDLKALLPSYQTAAGEFHWTALAFDEWTFPDPSFNGILPGISTTDGLKLAFELEGVYEDAQFAIDEWVGLARGPTDAAVYTLSGNGNLQQLATDLASSTARPTLSIVPPDNAVVLARNSQNVVLVAVTREGRLHTRPADVGTAWVQRATLPVNCCWVGAAESPAGAGTFVVTNGGGLWETAADFSVVSAREPVPASPAQMIVDTSGGVLVVLSFDGKVLTGNGVSPWSQRVQLPFDPFGSSWDPWVGIVKSSLDGDLWAITESGELYEIDSAFAGASARPSLAASNVVAVATAPGTGELLAMTGDGRIFSRPDDATSTWTLRLTLPRTVLP